MNHTPTSSRRALRRAFALLSLPGLLGLTAAAQNTSSTAADGKESTVKLDQFVVTGSYIPYAADAPATPVTTLTSTQIQDSGIGGDLLEVIRKTVPQFTGAGNLGSSNGDIGSGSTGGGSAIALRNTATLVLINGRRAAFNPIVGTGGFQFVDVNSIPVSAVERIEIVTDGASATYGSDAVAGVVNIILKSNYSGLEIGGQYKHSTTGPDNWEERSMRLVTGATLDKTSLTLSAEWVKSDPIYYKDRAVSTPNFGTPTFPGVVQVGPTATGRYYLLASSLNAPGANLDLTEAQLVANGTYTGPFTLDQITQIFDLSRMVTMQIASEKKSFTAAFTHDISPAAQFFGDIVYSKINTFSQLNAQPITSVGAQTHVAGDARNPFNITVRARNRFVDYPRQYLYDADSLRFVGGFRGKFAANHSYEIAANYNRIDQLYRNKNVIDTAKFLGAIGAGTINLFARNQAPGAIASANMFGTAYANNYSTLKSIDGRVFGELAFSLPGGPVSYAVGFESRKENLKSEPDLGSYTDPNTGLPVQWDGANPANPFSEQRTIHSFYAQLRFPLSNRSQNIPGFYAADLDVAVRTDRYSDTTDPTVPKVMLRWLPFNDEFAVRATFSKSFIAPNLFQLKGPVLLGNTPEITGFRGADGATYASLGQLDTQLPPNAALKPSKSKNVNLGLVYSPKNVKGLKLELAYFDVRQTDIVANVPSQDMLQDVELRGSASPYASLVRFGGFTGPAADAPGQVVNGRLGLDPVLINPLVNFASSNQKGLDFGAHYTTDTSYGRWDLSANGVHWNSYTINGAETAGYATAINGTIPKWLWFTTADLSHGNWSVGASVQYIGRNDETLDNGATIQSKVPAFTAVDLRAAYTFTKDRGVLRWLDGLRVRVGVNNATDQEAPPAPDVFNNANADTATYYTGMIGRVIYVDATYKF